MNKQLLVVRSRGHKTAIISNLAEGCLFWERVRVKQIWKGGWKIVGGRIGNQIRNLRRHYYLSTLPRPSIPIHRGKMEQILLAYGLPKETVAAIMILYRNTKVKVRSPDGDTEYFDIVAGVLQGDTLAPYFFIICLDYVLRTSIDKIRENGFELTKRRSKRYPAKTITDADYADDLAILANTPNQAETLLHSLERAAAGIGLHVNANKTEYMCYKASHQPKKTSTHDWRRHGQLSIGSRSYGSRT